MVRARHVVLLNATSDESDMYAWWLESSGYCVSVVRDGPGVWRLATTDLLDVLVIDAMFAFSETGVQLPEPLKALSRRCGFGIITLSGYLPPCPPEPPPREICILKPCLPPQLSERIDQLLSGSQQS